MQCSCAILPRGLPRFAIFSTLSHKQYDFWRKKKTLLITKCVFWFPLQHLSGTFRILGRTGLDVNRNVDLPFVEYPLFFCHFNETWIFATFFQRILNIKFRDNRPCGIRVVPCGQPNGNMDGRTDGRADMTKQIVALAIFQKRPQQNDTTWNKQIHSISKCRTF